jgi:transposase
VKQVKSMADKWTNEKVKLQEKLDQITKQLSQVENRSLRLEKISKEKLKLIDQSNKVSRLSNSERLGCHRRTEGRCGAV